MLRNRVIRTSLEHTTEPGRCLRTLVSKVNYIDKASSSEETMIASDQVLMH